ncbi:hypothetical protein TRIP_C60271 [Candidatus Zixiibacteriota bacterium]|nr:hypothetical protein TRIP_C60271 [candidate division Zixibacteria bacterium]
MAGRIIRRIFVILSIISIIVIGCQKKSIEPQGSTEWRVMGKAERFSFGTPVRDVMVTLGDDSCLTDTVGAFRFDDIASGKYQVAVKSDEFKLYSDSLSVTQNIAYDITLQDSANLVGQVKNLSGVKLPGIAVVVGNQVDTTDIDGIYRFKSAPGGKSSIYCYFPGYYPFQDTVTVTSNYRRRDLTLQSEFNLVGYVRNRAGLPISGAIVSIYGMADTTDEMGYYEFALVPMGNQTITCNQSEFYPFQDTIAITAQQQTFIILMGSKYNLVGYVSHTIEGPIHGAVVSVGEIADTTDDNGYYQLALVPLGNQIISCNQWEYYPLQDTIQVTDWQQTHDITMNSKYNLVGQVYHHIEGPIEGAIVSVGAIKDTTDILGNYELPLVPIGNQLINCSKGSYFDFTDTLEVTAIQQQLDISLFRIVADTFFVTEDATVAYDSRKSLEDSNINTGSLAVQGYCFMDLYFDGDTFVFINDYWGALSLMKLPDAGTAAEIAEADSVTLVLTLSKGPYYVSCGGFMSEVYLAISKLQGDWSEQTVTNNTRPSASLWKYVELQGSNGPTMALDIRTLYSNPMSAQYGIMLSTTVSCCNGCCPEEMDCAFYSSEYSDVTKRPKVVVCHRY